MVNDAIPIIALLLLACNNSTLTLTKITLIWNLIQNIYSICFVQKIIFELSISAGYSSSPDLANAATVSVSLIEGNEGKTAKFGEKWS